MASSTKGIGVDLSTDDLSKLSDVETVVLYQQHGTDTEWYEPDDGVSVEDLLRDSAVKRVIVAEFPPFRAQLARTRST